MVTIELVCPKCKSTDIILKNEECLCNSCGELFKKPSQILPATTPIHVFSYHEFQEAVRKQYKEDIKKLDEESKIARIRFRKFNWKKDAEQIPAVATVLLVVISILSSFSMRSEMVTPFMGAAVVSGIIFLILKIRK